MPTYQYLCTECGDSLEVQQSFTDDALTVCPECNGRLRKVFNAVGVVFKGSGFYATDSRSKDKSSTAASSSDSKAPAKSDGGSDAKPAATKSETKTESKKTSDSGSAA